MAVALQTLAAGVAAGSVYGLFAVGHTLFYRLTGIVHFAFGDLVGLGVFATLLVLAGTGPAASAGADPGRFALALGAGLAVSVAAGAGTYLVVVQPAIQARSVIGWVAGTIAVAFAVRTVLAAVFTRPSYVFPDPLPFRKAGDGGYVHVGGVVLQARLAFVAAVALALVALSAWILGRTRFGRAVRAVSADADAAALVGVPVDRLLALAFAGAGAVALLAALASAPTRPVGVDLGTMLGLKGLLAALAARFGPVSHALAAGLVLGVAEAAIANLDAGPLHLGPAYREVLPLLAVLVLLAWRPPPAPAGAE